MAVTDHPRLILHNFISPDLCKELEFIHKSCSTIGYRPNVFSTTLSHLIATNSPHLIMPFVPIRERLKERVEEFFGCEYELFIEFTGLISWTRGASIGWHSDNNRPYLKQRDFADVVMYTADSRNIHSVDEITDGERLTLTLWFSRDGSHDEDAKLISFISQIPLDSKSDLHLPLPASNNMYWFPPDKASGFDIRCARLHVLGYDLYSSWDKSYFSAVESSKDSSDLLIEPLQLARGDELFNKEFSNILHALQVVQFYCWKASELQTSEGNKKSDSTVPISETQWDRSRSLKLVFVKDWQLAETILGRVSTAKQKFDWASFSDAIAAWEAYTSKYSRQILMSLPNWKTHQFIFSDPPAGLEEGT